LNQALIGIPRYLGYFSFRPLWETYFRELGFSVATSPPSNPTILDEGVRETVNDACIPIKMFHGHVAALRDRVDYLFIPRLAGSRMRYTVCPKFLGLPDMVRASVSDLPEILSPRLQMGSHGLRGLRPLLDLGVKMSGGLRLKAVRALHRARCALGDEVRRIRDEGLQTLGFTQPTDADLTVGLVGYPYVLYDRLSSGDILPQLFRLGVRVVTPEMIDQEILKRESRAFPENLFWYYSNRSLWTGMHLMKTRQVHGLLHITAFGCGPDAMVSKLLELEAAEWAVPFMAVTVDEHTGELGLQTRSEAFVDMLRWQKEGDHVS